MIALDRLPPSIWAEPGDRHADFCLWPYQPLSQVAGKLRSEAFMWAALSLDPDGHHLGVVAEALVAGLGRGQTVWGLKQVDGRLTWEFYFYDYERLDRTVSLQRVLAILGPFAPCSLMFPEDRPYFMVSIDLDPAALAGREPIEEVNIYVGNAGSEVSSGLSYRLSRHGLEYANLYHFFDTAGHDADIRQKLITSARLPADPALADRLLDPRFRGAVTVVANKRSSDGLYHSRVRARQLPAFLEAYHYPAALTGFVTANLERFSHLYFDLGLDYAMIQGEVRVMKTAVYGLL